MRSAVRKGVVGLSSFVVGRWPNRNCQGRTTKDVRPGLMWKTCEIRQLTASSWNDIFVRFRGRKECPCRCGRLARTVERKFDDYKLPFRTENAPLRRKRDSVFDNLVERASREKKCSG
jgi:hypothetical protein